MRSWRGGPEPAAVPALGIGIAGAVLVFVVLCGVWLYQPPYRPTDEASHVAYARELSHGRLPTIDSPMSADGDLRLARLLRSRDAVHRTIWTANHPPLYYALAAVPLRIAEATGHPIRGLLAARLLSVGLSALGLVVLAYTVLQLVPGRPQLAVAATGLTALLPSFINVAAVVYNDSLAFLTSTCALAAVVVLVIRGPSATRLAAVAATVALATLTRASGLLVAGVAALAVFLAVWRAGEGTVWRRLVRAGGWVGALVVTVVATAGWFYLRNRTLYGDLTGSAALLERFGRVPHGTVPELLGQPGFWRSQQQRLWGVTTNLPGSGGRLSRQLWLLGLVPLVGLLVAGAR
jgi:4-amino-4-deoxy-L-arabinose transferase-like glycosyltransferase